MTDWFHVQSLIHAILINESLCIRSDFIQGATTTFCPDHNYSLAYPFTLLEKGKAPTFKDVLPISRHFYQFFSPPNFSNASSSFSQPETKGRGKTRCLKCHRFSKTDVSRESLRSCRSTSRVCTSEVFVGAETRPKFRRSEQSCGFR